MKLVAIHNKKKMAYIQNTADVSLHKKFKFKKYFLKENGGQFMDILFFSAPMPHSMHFRKIRSFKKSIKAQTNSIFDFIKILSKEKYKKINSEYFMKIFIPQSF